MRENLALSEQLFGVVALSARGLESDAGVPKDMFLRLLSKR